MGTVLTDFYKKAGGDKELGENLWEIRRKYDDGKINKETAITEVIALAKTHNTVLTRADFDAKFSQLEESELASIAGGGACVGNISACSANAQLCN
ncbi:MAG: hypothetical protein LBT68_03740 [Spirochaetales bacterium]|jgi:hypothetical protein|nr:hypothetical protein [Spirochaetales bacterium]